MDVAKFELEIKRHAFQRAMERGVTPDMIEATFFGGKIIRYGKNQLKFIRQYKNYKVVCVGRFKGEKIIIVTILVEK
ncbi:MAG: DUF4258 domain-containing protein [Nanoarchaeota archaeon]|nr:DUF4258 domain-containing protein [Nanoarchaeota archaeon]MBU1321283.1 DUF4258 domain-containing protein [Nanoarchaeota archaeon]MBU1597113.1 DUF4258 domain-containing protein [Nanoarchaeota archaeon]MBU2442144.1 DUF4258 domain-containing protein [Nanoarchaeota archaeon]